MTHWHFFQGVRGEWRWYHVDPRGRVLSEGELDFADMAECMADARLAGFDDHAFAVHAWSSLPRFPRRRRRAADLPDERRTQRAADARESR